MKTLRNQTLLYDEDCPLCKVYTSGFIKVGMLDENGKKSYCRLSAQEQNYIDVKRASNEIALFDNVNKTVIYGIESLLKVIGFSFPWMAKVGNIRPVKYLLQKLYSFISYNRKVIIPGKINKVIALQCVPDFSFMYRNLLIIFTISVSSFLFHLFDKQFSILEIIGFQMALFLFQSLLFLKFSKEIVLNFLGNFAVSVFCGALLLIPIIILKIFFDIPENVHKAYFCAMLIVVVIDIFRRIKIIKFNLS